MAPETSPDQTAPSGIRFLTVAEVATILRVSNATVYRLIDGGELEATRAGHAYRISEPAFSEYLQIAHQVGAAD